MAEFPNLFDHVLVWIFGLIIPFMSGVQSRQGLDQITFTESVRRRFYLANSFFLAMAASVILITWWWQDRPWSAMYFKSSFSIQNPGWTLAIVALLSLLYLSDILHSIKQVKKGQSIEQALDEGTPFLPRYPRELPAYLLMCLSAGVFEEIIYRGYLVTYFRPEYNHDTGLPFLAVCAPAVLFSLAHYYQGWQAVIKIFLLSVLLAIIFLVSQNILVVMLIHTSIDLLGGLLAMKLLRD
jgi:membrane protease YdiL (CAAX protease family)